ncbi:hypothetical protein [Halalkalibacter oceani]|uniref:hypothetical protein n=1 Tax=Halalkalibacter oceani TaxID=1653776 RepID=UPI003397E2E4
MTLRVYYDEIDGELHPQWLLLPANTSEEYATYTVVAPFERFWPEDFHDSMAVITVTQAALVRDPFHEKDFSIHIPRVVEDLASNGGNMESLHNAEYFLVRFDDLEELLQMNVRRFYLG